MIQERCFTEVRFFQLADIAETVSGLSRKCKADFTDGSARYVSYKNVFANLAVDQEAKDFVKVAPGERQHRLRLGDVVFTGSSETAEEVGMSSVIAAEPIEPLYLNSFCFALRFNDPELLDPAFSKYLFREASVRKAIGKSASGVTRINISKVGFMKIRIPVPPIEEQRRIASILDKFDALVSDLSVGLPAELNARRKQYEHYRDRLLTFQEATV